MKTAQSSFTNNRKIRSIASFMRFFVFLSVLICLQVGIFVCNGQNTNAGKTLKVEVSEADKEAVKRQFLAIDASLKQAVNSWADGDLQKVDTSVGDFKSAFLELAVFFENQKLRPFAVGLSAGAKVFSAANDRGLKREDAALLLEKIVRTFGTGKSVHKGATEGVSLVLLQQYYHLKKWEEGAQLIRQTGSRGLESAEFVREVLGFANGMIKYSALTNEACDVYSFSMNDSVRPPGSSFSQGESLLFLSHLYGYAKNSPKQLETLNSIRVKDPVFAAANKGVIAYFEFSVYTRLADITNAVVKLAETAKAYQANPASIKDEVILEQLPVLLKQYQDSGYINEKIEIVPYHKIVPKIEPQRLIVRKIVVVLLALVTLTPLVFFAWSMKRKTVEGKS